MGVKGVAPFFNIFCTGLWTLLSPSAHKISLESLRTRRIAVDISVWLHQLVRGINTNDLPFDTSEIQREDFDGDMSSFDDYHARKLHKLYLMAMFHRLCKLLYFGIRPVIVFDGQVPLLKQATMQKRKRQQRQDEKKLQLVAKKLLHNQLQSAALSHIREALDVALRKPKKSKKKETPKKQQMEEEEGGFFAEDMATPPKNVQLIDDDEKNTSVKDGDSDLEQIENSITTPPSSPLREGAVADVENIDPKVFKDLPPAMQEEIVSQLRTSRRWKPAALLRSMESQDPNQFSNTQLQNFLKGTKATRALQQILSPQKDIQAEQMVERQGEAIMSGSLASDPSTHFVLMHRDAPMEEIERHLNSEENPIAIDEDVEKNGALETNSTDKQNTAIVEVQPPPATTENQDDEFVSCVNDEEPVMEIDLQNTTSIVDDELFPAAMFNANVEDTLPEVQPQQIQNHQHQQQPKHVPAPEFQEPILIRDSPDRDSQLPLLIDAIEEDEDMQKAIALSLVDGLESKQKSQEVDEDVMMAIAIEESIRNASTPKQAMVADTIFDEEEAENRPVDKQTKYNAFLDDDENENKDKGKGKGSLKPKPPTLTVEDIEPTEEEQQSMQNDEEDEDDGLKMIDDVDDLEMQKAIEQSMEDNSSSQTQLEQPSLNVDPYAPVFSSPPRTLHHSSPVNSDSPGDSMRLRLLQERAQLMVDQDMTFRKVGGKISQQLIEDTQALLQLFGIPYVNSPYEADSQCGFLCQNGLVDGVITEDSDVFLFGCHNVYRHVFSQKSKEKHAEEYSFTKIFSKLGLNRNQLVELALLLGSDYTDGVYNVGIVTSIQLVDAFKRYSNEDNDDDEEQILQPLEEFKKWTLEAKKPPKPVAHERDQNVLFKYKYNRMKQRYVLPKTFPERRVVEAYLKPQVDASLEPFQWGQIDLKRMLVFCSEQFNWDKLKMDQFLKPVLDSMKQNQTRIENFLTSGRVAVIKSKRIQGAVQSLTAKRKREAQQDDDDDVAEDVDDKPKKKKLRKS